MRGFTVMVIAESSQSMSSSLFAATSSVSGWVLSSETSRLWSLLWMSAAIAKTTKRTTQIPVTTKGTAFCWSFLWTAAELYLLIGLFCWLTSLFFISLDGFLSLLETSRPWGLFRSSSRSRTFFSLGFVFVWYSRKWYWSSKKPSFYLPLQVY